MNDTPETTVEEERHTNDATEPILSVEHLGQSFGDVAVFSDLTFSLEAGTVTALVGPNGSGKTTLLRAILGLLSTDEGTVRLPDPAESGRRVGYLPQEPAFRSSFTVTETLEFYADLLDTEVDVAETVDRIGLSQAGDRRVDALSGGMTRLLGIGQAILGDPPLVVLDEPTGDLDPRMTEYIFDLVGTLADEGMAVLLATHNLTGAEEADTVLLIDHGDVVAEASPEEFVAEADADSFREAFLALTGGEADAIGASPSVAVRTRGEGE